MFVNSIGKNIKRRILSLITTNKTEVVKIMCENISYLEESGYYKIKYKPDINAFPIEVLINEDIVSVKIDKELKIPYMEYDKITETYGAFKGFKQNKIIHKNTRLYIN